MIGDSAQHRAPGHIQGNENPNWYRWMDYGGRISWQYFEISVWDSDIGSDDGMTSTLVRFCL